ncbi:hypothetical protein Tco_0163923 [Tanacetum coccineum]
MEQKQSSYGGSGCDHFLPLSAKYPWFVAQNLGAEEDSYGDHYFFTLHDPLTNYQCQIPKLLGRRIRGYYHGWVILSDHLQHVIWSIWNTVTSKMIHFSHLILKDRDSDSIRECSLNSFIIQLNILVEDKEVLIKLLLLGANPYPSWMHKPCTTYFLKGHDTELFCIMEKMVDLKDAIFFVDLGRDNLAYYRPRIASELGGYIQIRDKTNNILYSYHVKENTISISSMPSLVPPTSNVSVWEGRLEDDHGGTMCTVDSKQEENQIEVRSVTDNETRLDEWNLLNLPFDILEIIMERCGHREEEWTSRKGLDQDMFGSPEPRHYHSESPQKRDPERKTVFQRLEKGVFHKLGDKGKSTSAYSNDSRHLSYHTSRRDTKSCYQSSRSRETEIASEKCHNKRASSQRMEALLESEGSIGGHWKSKPRRLLPPAKKCIKDLVEIYNIKQRDGESTKEFMRRYKLECRDVKGAPKCMKISGFMHGITNPELIKQLHDKISKSVDEMMRVTTTFLRGEVAASNHERKKSFPSWKQQEAGHKQNFKKGGFRNQQRPERKQDRFTLLTKTPKEMLALDKGEFKPPPPMTTLVEKRNTSKFCEFHEEVGHTTDECMHLKRQIEEMLKAGKLSHLIKELKQRSGKDQAKEDGTKGSMIVEAEIGGNFVHRMHVDRGSTSKIMYEHCFNRFRPEIGDEEHSTSAWMNFMVVRSPSSYNGIIGRPGVRRI